MLRTLTLQEYTIKFRNFQNDGDYNLEVYFDPIRKGEEVLGHNTQRIIVPFTCGLIDTTIASDKYTCLIFYDDEQTGQEAVKGVTFKKKFVKDSSYIQPQEASEMAQIADSSVQQSFRKICSPSGKDWVTVSDGLIELVSGDTKLTVSNNQITMFGNMVDHNLPSKSQGGLFAETGILRFLPKAFVPPFCIPAYLPDISTITTVFGKMQVVKEIMDAYNSIGG